MTTLAATVYLNHGPDNFFGLNATAQLRQTAQFDLTAAQLQSLAADWAIAYREAGHRSFSIGDVAVVGETAFACDSGWTRISADDLAAALAH